MMNSPKPPLQGVSAPVLRAARQGLGSAAVILMIIWLAAWSFEINRVITSAASLTAIMLALLVFGARYVFDRKHPEVRDSTWPSSGMGSRSHQDQACVDPLTAGLVVRSDDRRWSLDVFAHIDARRFATVCETWFSWAGFDTRSESLRTNEGVDIWLHAPKVAGPVAIVRCKHGQDKPIGLQEMRDFHGVLSSCKTAHGTFTTTSTYTPEALQFARDNGIDAVDGPRLLRRIKTRTRQSQQALLAVAYNGH